MKTVFSIVVTVYNRADCLLRALESVERQTFTSYEVIIVDDGSTDNTAELLAEYQNQQRNHQTKIISLSVNKGVANARNLAIEKAGGSLITFLDSDDEWRSDYLAVMAQALSENSSAILAYSHYHSVLPESSKIQEVRIYPQQSDLVREMLVNNFIHTMSCVVVRAEVFDSVGRFEPRLKNCSDREFYLRAFSIGKPIVVPHLLVRKYWRRDSLTVLNYSQQWLENGLKLLDIFFANEANAKYLSLRKAAEDSLRQRVNSSRNHFDDRPKVSLIIANYNNARYLRAAIESVLAQTYRHFELLIWDDGSTDNAVAIALEYEHLDSRVKVVQHSHQGFTKSLLEGLKVSQGEYVGWVDSDDLLHPQALAATVNCLNRHPTVGMVYTERVIIDELGKTIGLDPRSSMSYSPDKLLLNFITFHFRLIRREVYERAGGIDPKFTTAQDYDLCLRISEITKIERINQPLYFYRQHSSSISQVRAFEQVACTQKAIQNALLRRKLAPNIELKLKLKPKFRLHRRLNDSSCIDDQKIRLKSLAPLSIAEGDRQLISLVTTVYNRETYLAATIESILAQTYQDFELIIWDDGSSDCSLAVAQTYARQDSRIKVYTATNQGQVTALVLAIAQAKGKYLASVDSDDLLHPEALAKTLSVLESNFNVGMVYTNHIVIDADGRDRGLGKRNFIPYSKERLLIDFMTFHFRLMRRDVYDAVGGFDSSLKSAEDYDLCLKLSEFTKVEHLAEPLYYYRWHDNNLSSTQQLAQTECSATAINRALVRRGVSSKLELKVELNPSYSLERQLSSFECR